MAKNGKASSGKRTKHINIRYFFVADRIGSNELTVEYCPTGDMTGDFFTKPLQGAQFIKFRKEILNLEFDDLSMYNIERSQECVGINKAIPDEGRTACSDVADSNVVTSPQPRTYAEAVRTNVRTNVK